MSVTMTIINKEFILHSRGQKDRIAEQSINKPVYSFKKTGNNSRKRHAGINTVKQFKLVKI